MIYNVPVTDDGVEDFALEALEALHDHHGGLEHLAKAAIGPVEAIHT